MWRAHVAVTPEGWPWNKAFIIIIPFLYRSSDSEEAFETPESTTPVKSAPPIPIPALPEVQEQQPQQRQDLEEVLPPPPKPEEPGIYNRHTAIGIRCCSY